MSFFSRVRVFSGRHLSQYCIYVTTIDRAASNHSTLSIIYIWASPIPVEGSELFEVLEVLLHGELTLPSLTLPEGDGHILRCSPASHHDF